jgi:hypothetical protein
VDQRTIDEALMMAHNYFGRTWKSHLRHCWEIGMYPSGLGKWEETLQYVRNIKGPSPGCLRISFLTLFRQQQMTCKLHARSAKLLGS